MQILRAYKSLFFKHPLDFVKNGLELYGVVIQSGVNPKTVTVKCNFATPYPLLKKFKGTTRFYQVHDESEDVREGDKVIVRPCLAITKTKHLYVERIVKRRPMVDAIEGPSRWELEAMEYNKVHA
jgi:ribosomal protein S17